MKIMSHDLPPCTIGELLKLEDCHKSTKVKGKHALLLLSNMEEEVKKTYIWRAGLNDKTLGEDATICLNHENKFGIKYINIKRQCLNIYNYHNKKPAKGVRMISFEMAQYLRTNNIWRDVIPGQKLCPKCFCSANKGLQQLKEGCSSTKYDSPDSSSDASIISSESPSSDNHQERIEVEQSRKRTNDIMSVVGKSPIKLHSLTKKQRLSYGKNKMTSAVRNLNKEICSSLDLPNQEILFETPKTTERKQMDKTLKKKANDFDTLMVQLKEKLDSSNSSREEKIKILSLKPESWSISQTADYFSVSKYMVRKAMIEKEAKGILPSADKIGAKCYLSGELKDHIQLFYLGDESSFELIRIMPGQKDYVSLSKNVHAQKRLLLCNIDELYSLYCQCYPDKKVGKSTFYSLRPKQCITVSAYGTHSVCVCVIHQNAKLMVEGLIHSLAGEIEQKTYKDFINMTVCSNTNKDCMLGCCSSCPEAETLKQYLQEWFGKEGIEEITYEQWVSTDKCEIEKITKPIDDFIHTFCASMFKLRKHAYIAKSQSTFLRDLKCNLGSNEVVVLLDFAENYSYVVQDEVQSFHWNNSQCSLHPCVIYFLDANGKLCTKSFCIVSEDLLHDVSFVYEVQRIITKWIKEHLGQIDTITYFSDGCAQQYKNYKNFINLLCHSEDFGLAARWAFFATSHGKSPCDGIGGTVKRLVKRASLQKRSSILNVFDFMQYCQNNIDAIIFKHLSTDTLQDVRANLEKRFEGGNTIPGTRSYHLFEPLSKGVIGFKYIACDNDYAGKMNFFSLLPKYEAVQPMDFVACSYNKQWWVGMVLSINNELKDAEIKFMKPAGPSSSFSWPIFDDICNIPYCDVICKIPCPQMHGRGRTYVLSPDVISDVNVKFLQRL